MRGSHYSMKIMIDGESVVGFWTAVCVLARCCVHSRGQGLCSTRVVYSGYEGERKSRVTNWTLETRNTE